MELALYLYHSKGNTSKKIDIYEMSYSSADPVSLARIALKGADEHGWDSFVFKTKNHSSHSNSYTLRDEELVLKLATDNATSKALEQCLSTLRAVLKYQLTPVQEERIRRNYHLNGFLDCLPHSKKLIILDKTDAVPDSIKLRFYQGAPTTTTSRREPEKVPSSSVSLDKAELARARQLEEILSRAKNYIVLPHPITEGQNYDLSDYSYIKTMPFHDYAQVKPVLKETQIEAELKSFITRHPRFVGLVSPDENFGLEFTSPAHKSSGSYKLGDLVTWLLHNALIWGEIDTAMVFEKAMVSQDISATEVYVLNTGNLPAGEICDGVRIIKKFRSSADIWQLTSVEQEIDVNNSCGFDSYISRSILLADRKIKFQIYNLNDPIENPTENSDDGFSIHEFLKCLSLVSNTNLRSQLSWVKVGTEAGITPSRGRTRGPSGDVNCDIREEDIVKAYALSQATLQEDVKEICGYAISQKIRARGGDFRHTLKNIFTTLELIYIKDSERGSKKDKIAKRMTCHLGETSSAITEIIEGLYDQRTKANHSGDLKVEFADKVIVDGREVIVGRLVEHLEILCTQVIEKLIADNDLTSLRQIINKDIAVQSSKKKPQKKKKRR